MFLRVVLVLFLCGFSLVFGQNKLLDEAFWKTATPAQVQAKIKKGADVNARDKHGWTPLMLASGFNTNVAVLKALLKADADVEASSKYGMTSLMAAARYNENVDVLKVLLKAGADVEASSKSGMTSLMAAAEFNQNLAFIKALLKAVLVLMQEPKAA